MVLFRVSLLSNFNFKSHKNIEFLRTNVCILNLLPTIKEDVTANQETFCILLAAQTSSFWIHPLPQTQLLLKLQGVAYHLMHSDCVTYGKPCLSIASHLNSCLGKQRISLGLASFLNMRLCSNTWFTSQQKVLLCGFCLCVRDCYGTLNQSLAGFEPIVSLITLCDVRCLSYPLGHTAF